MINHRLTFIINASLWKWNKRTIMRWKRTANKILLIMARGFVHIRGISSGYHNYRKLAFRSKAAQQRRRYRHLAQLTNGSKLAVDFEKFGNLIKKRDNFIQFSGVIFDSIDFHHLDWRRKRGGSFVVTWRCFIILPSEFQIRCICIISYPTRETSDIALFYQPSFTFFAVRIGSDRAV